MALPVANLDDRTFQDIVNEARRRIPQYCPEWTDHNLSDPGITLIELFSWMTEMLIYRMNKVPDKNYVKFLELLGVTLTPARACKHGGHLQTVRPSAYTGDDSRRHGGRHCTHGDGRVHRFHNN